MAVCCVAKIVLSDSKFSLNSLSNTHVSRLLFENVKNNNLPWLQRLKFGGNVNHAHTQANQLITKTNNSGTLQQQVITGLPQRRYFSDQRPPKPISLPRLMDFPQIAWPNILKALKNWVLAKLIITPYFDRDFNLQDFMTGSKQAVEFVSHCLANGEYNKLEAVVDAEALREIKNSIATFSVQQRADLAVNKEDIYFCFPYQVGVMFDEDQNETEQQKRYVEITMCYHVLRGLQEVQSQTERPPLNIGASAEFQDKVFILNYRFIREFTKEVAAEWTVNVVNHYRPSDYV